MKNIKKENIIFIYKKKGQKYIAYSTMYHSEYLIILMTLKNQRMSKSTSTEPR